MPILQYSNWQNFEKIINKAKVSCENGDISILDHFTDVSFYYLCSCLSTQFLYRTAVKATFNVKENIKDIIKNSITLTINITTITTKIRKIGGKKPHLLIIISYV